MWSLLHLLSPLSLLCRLFETGCPSGLNFFKWQESCYSSKSSKIAVCCRISSTLCRSDFIWAVLSLLPSSPALVWNQEPQFFLSDGLQMVASTCCPMAILATLSGYLRTVSSFSKAFLIASSIHWQPLNISLGYVDFLVLGHSRAMYVDPQSHTHFGRKIF